MVVFEITKKSITANGHASEQLICNSISVLLWALAVSLDKANANGLAVEEGNGYQQISYEPTPETVPIFDGFVECIRQIASQYPKEMVVFEKK